MHPYYREHQEKFRKMQESFLHFIAAELETATGQPYNRLQEEIWAYYQTHMLENFPYIGGDHSGGTRNLTGAFLFVAMGEVCRSAYGMSLEQWGLLTTCCYERYMAQIPGWAWTLVGKLLQKPKLMQRLLRKKDAQNAANAAQNLGSFVTETQPSTPEYPVEYHTLVCPLANFARDFGYEAYMPYLCNLDYVMFAAARIPFYREHTCAAGDACCDFKLKAGAPVNRAWPCHGVTPGDPLK